MNDKNQTEKNKSDTSAHAGSKPDQLLHLVFGGELTSLDGIRFRDLENLDIVGIYSGYDAAHAAWKAKAQATVDNAHQRYFIVHIHRLMDPEETLHQAEKG